MTAFIKNEFQNYQPKFNHLMKKLHAVRLFKWVNSGTHVKDYNSADLTILGLLIICAFLFWI